MKSYITYSENETRNFAKKLAKMVRQAHHGQVLALTGELGAGKTTFVQGFAKGLRIKEKIISPTFVLIHQHKIPHSKKMLFHIDLYRLDGEINIKELGISELINSEDIVLVEWAEKIKNLLPQSTTWILLEKQGNSRKIIINA